MTGPWRRALLALAVAVAAAGCAPVAAWQRGGLADRRMQPSLNSERDALRSHVLSVREGAAGGQGAAGGGCGCD